MGKKKPGPKPKDGTRYACGKLKPTGEPIVPAEWARIRAEAGRIAKTAQLASEIGRLSVHREISDKQAAAAVRIGAIYGNYERFHRCRRSAAAQAYEFGFRGEAGIAEELMSPAAIENRTLAEQAATEAYQALMTELHILYPANAHNARMLIETVCVDDQPIAQQDLPQLRLILDDFASFFGTGSRKRARKGRPSRRVENMIAAPAPADAPTAPPKREPIDQVIMRKIIARLRPDLDERAIAQICEVSEVLKQREAFARTKHGDRPALVVSNPAVKLDRPVLRLKAQEEAQSEPHN